MTSTGQQIDYNYMSLLYILCLYVLYSLKFLIQFLEIMCFSTHIRFTTSFTFGLVFLILKLNLEIL